MKVKVQNVIKRNGEEVSFKVIEKIKCDFEIVEMDNLEGFAIKNRQQNEVITIYDEELIQDAIAKNFNKKYRELLYLVMDVNESDDATETDTELVLMKIDDLRKKILNMKFLSKEQLNKYLKMLLLLNEKLRVPEIGRGR